MERGIDKFSLSKSIKLRPGAHGLLLRLKISGKSKTTEASKKTQVALV